MLSPAALCELVAPGGEPDLRMRALDRPLEPWLEQAGTVPAAAARIRAALARELGGGPATGCAPSVVDGQTHFRQTFASCLAAG
jgi:hypothetical protein